MDDKTNGDKNIKLHCKQFFFLLQMARLRGQYPFRARIYCARSFDLHSFFRFQKILCICLLMHAYCWAKVFTGSNSIRRKVWWRVSSWHFNQRWLTSRPYRIVPPFLCTETLRQGVHTAFVLESIVRPVCRWNTYSDTSNSLDQLICRRLL